MSVSSSTDFYLDPSQYSKMKLGARNESIETTKAVAEQFESLFVQQMLASMRSAAKVDESNHSSTLDFYQEMYDKQLALNISKQGGLGIAKVLLQQLPGGAEIGVAQASSEQRTQGLLALISGTDGKSLPIGTVQKMISLPIANPSATNRPDAQESLTPILKTSPQASPTVPTMYQTKSYQAQNPAVKVSPFQTDDLQTSESVLASQVGSGKRWREPSNFVSDVWLNAQMAANTLGISTQALVAQSALETGWGEHSMRHPDGQQAFNLFGIKADSRWDGPTITKPTLEFRDGMMQTEIAHFRAYESIPEALDDYVEFIQSNARYQSALDHKGDDAYYLKELQLAGYATDPQYANKIINIMQGQTLGVSIANLKSDRSLIQENNHG
jgi:flagellar protein FlgJ